MAVTPKILTLTEFEQYFNSIATLRFDYFGEFPYLYAGRKLDDEFIYLSGYLKHPDGRIVTFFDEHNTLIAICTGYPLARDMSEPFNITGWIRNDLNWNSQKLKDTYYLGEVIIQRNFRNLNILKKITQYGESELPRLGYRYLTFITVERPKNHPLRPENYRDFGDKMHRLNFEKLNHTLIAPYNTLQADGSYRTEENPMAIWLKDLHTTPSLLA